MAKSIVALQDTYEPLLAKEFLDAAQDIAINAQIGQVVSSLESADIAGALAAIYMERGAFRDFEDVIGNGYVEAGNETIKGFGRPQDLNGQRFVIRFNDRNFRAEKYIRAQSGALVTRILKEQHQSLAKALLAGMEAGQNPKAVALDIIGRINRATGRREGGLIGLSRPQSNAVAKARLELAGGDYREFLSRSMRDKRFDRTLFNAIKNDTALNASQINKITGRYSDNLLRLRGETIARTEMLTSLHAGQNEGLQQLLDTDKVNENQVKRIWDAAGDGRVRDTHSSLDGQTVGPDEAFISSSGARLMYPGDPAGGSAEVINCRCYMRIDIDFLAGIQ